jgi:hypothetical protein
LPDGSIKNHLSFSKTTKHLHIQNKEIKKHSIKIQLSIYLIIIYKTFYESRKLYKYYLIKKENFE